MKEQTIVKTADYRLYKFHGVYCIDYADRDPIAPIAWYKTIAGVKEALYYAGLLESKTAPLPR